MDRVLYSEILKKMKKKKKNRELEILGPTKYFVCPIQVNGK